MDHLLFDLNFLDIADRFHPFDKMRSRFIRTQWDHLFSALNWRHSDCTLYLSARICNLSIYLGKSMKFLLDKVHNDFCLN